MLEQGGDLRCYIFDNHRPIHLSNVHSRLNVKVIDDNSTEEPSYPSDGSDLDNPSSSDEESSDGDDIVVRISIKNI